MKNKKLKVVLTGYENVINSWIHTRQEAWSRFNIMLTTNSIIIGVIGFLLNDNYSSNKFRIILSVFGVLICILWLILTNRNDKFIEYNMYSALELEEKYLSEIVKYFSRGYKFSKGEEILFEFKNGGKKIKMGCISAKIPTPHISKITIILFMIFYITSIIIFYYENQNLFCT